MTMRFRKTKPVPRIEGPTRAAAYLRVSTGRQAESDLSIPDQRRQVAAYCAANGWQLMSEYVEPGASGMDDARPEFQKMIERAGDSDYPFDVIVVHSFSRFFRDGFGLEMYVRKLAKSGVRLVSITQQLGEDPSHALMRQMIGMFDGYQSLENGKHVSRAMEENARQGFYNGSRPPLGYMTQEVEKRGNRVKKRLVVDPVEAETVRLIFGLYRGGDGKSGPLGIKALTCWLNERGYRTRLGVRFGVGTVHKILVNRVYIGEWVFNRRCSKTQIEKPKAEHIPIAVPAIIERAEFEAVAASLKSNNPRVTPPRVVTGPVLLTGLATCATCSGPMTSRTGTSKSGKVYWYYSCSTHGRQGKFACTGHSIAMDTLDTLVTDHLVTELLQPDRLRATLAALWTSRIEKAAQVDVRVGALRTEITNAEDKLKRLYTMVEDGVTDLDDILRERLSVLKLDRDRAKAALDRIRITAQPALEIAPDLLERFGQMMRENVTSGEIPFRKAWIQSIVDCVEIDADVIRIIGDKASLADAISDGAAAPHAGVRSSVRKWRAPMARL